jgi:hypothetical protein
MSKPVLGSGNKAVLPSNILKPNKITFKKKFQMDAPDEKQSGFNPLVRNIEEDNVESLADNELNNNNRRPPLQ